MKLQTVLLMSHALPAIAVAAAFAASPLLSGAALWLVPLAAAMASVAIVSFVLTGQLRARLRLLQTVVSQTDESTVPAMGIDEWNQAAAQMAAHVARWDETAANGREQSREVQAILGLLDRRGGGRQASGGELRRVLAGIAQALQSQLDQWEQAALEIGRCTQEIADGAESQGNAVIKTSTYVEQLAANIDTVAADAKQVQVGILAAQRSTGEAAKLVDQLLQGMDRIRVHCEASERKIRGLNDPSRQISSIVGTIGDIAARTDLLALNASIESVRAGEHGRGFAVVAEEVRKLAEQASQATREVAGLIESMQLATQESIARLAEERGEVEAEAKRVECTGSSLQQICQAASDDAARAGDIALAAHRQLQLTQDVVLALEQISNIAKTSRGRAENVCWTVKSLAAIRRGVDDSLEPLRRCSDRRRGEALPNHVDVAANDGRQPSAVALPINPSTLSGDALNGAPVA